jgi:aspartate/methionine/tyrosine aminotransferase
VFRLIDEAQVGLAPGTSFGAGGEDFVRVCYARDPDQVADAMTRVAKVLVK